MTDSSIVLCATESEITEKRNRLKKWAKEQGIFSRVVGNTVQFTTGLAVTFVLAEQQEFDEEPLPASAYHWTDDLPRYARLLSEEKKG